MGSKLCRSYINKVQTEWKHVPGSANPVDIVRKEIDLLNTSIKDESFNGPQFLRNAESEWTCQEPSISQLSQLEMKTKNYTISNKNRV